MDHDTHPGDIVPPHRIARLIEDVAVRKIELGFLQAFALAVLAGAFIALGAAFYTFAVTGSELGFGPTRFLGGLAFSLGLILVIIGGAELFTGNSLIVIAHADNRITTRQLLHNWTIVYFGNLVGGLGTAVLIKLAGTQSAGDVAETAIAIAEAKVTLTASEALFRGLLCNVLVCLAVWMCFAARSVAGKVAVIVPPITAFVALGYEHSVANMYLIPIGMLEAGAWDLFGLAHNLVFVTLGNVIGGGLFVALVYWLIYVRPRGSPRD